MFVLMSTHREIRSVTGSNAVNLVYFIISLRVFDELNDGGLSGLFVENVEERRGVAYQEGVQFRHKPGSAGGDVEPLAVCGGVCEVFEVDLAEDLPLFQFSMLVDVSTGLPQLSRYRRHWQRGLGRLLGGA